MNDIDDIMLDALGPWIPAYEEMEYQEYARGEIESSLDGDYYDE